MNAFLDLAGDEGRAPKDGENDRDSETDGVDQVEESVITALENLAVQVAATTKADRARPQSGMVRGQYPEAGDDQRHRGNAEGGDGRNSLAPVLAPNQPRHRTAPLGPTLSGSAISYVPIREDAPRRM